MKSEFRQRLKEGELESTNDYEDSLRRFDDVTDEDIELFLSEKEEEKTTGVWNLPTIAGLSLILFGTGYLLQELGLWTGFNFSSMADMLPWLAGILIILIGFGVLSWKPGRKKKKKVKVVAEEAPADVKTSVTEISAKKRLRRSHNKKIAGVCGGIAEYFNLDPTIVRIAFVIATLFGQGSPILLYFILSFVMPKPDSPKTRQEERITIIRETS